MSPSVPRCAPAASTSLRWWISRPIDYGIRYHNRRLCQSRTWRPRGREYYPALRGQEEEEVPPADLWPGRGRAPPSDSSSSSCCWRVGRGSRTGIWSCHSCPRHGRSWAAASTRRWPTVIPFGFAGSENRVGHGPVVRGRGIGRSHRPVPGVEVGRAELFLLTAGLGFGLLSLFLLALGAAGFFSPQGAESRVLSSQSRPCFFGRDGSPRPGPGRDPGTAAQPSWERPGSGVVLMFLAVSGVLNLLCARGRRSTTTR